MSDAPLLKLGSAQGSRVSQQEQQQASENDALQPRDQSLLQSSAEAAQQQHPLHQRQPSPDNCNKAACGSGLKVLLSNLPDDIYVTTVASLVATRSAAVASTARCSAFRLPMAVLALLSTVVLQFALVGLLWQAATSGDGGVQRTEDEDRLWMQLGHTYHRMCEVNATVEELKGRWAKWPREALNTTAGQSQCLQSVMEDLGISTRVSSAKEISKCLDMERDELERNLSCRYMQMAALSGDLDFVWSVHNGIHKADHRVGAEYDTTWFIIVAFIALVIAVHDEVRRALRLCTVAAALTLVLPDFFGRDGYRVPTEKMLSKLHGTLVLLTPVLQLLVALAVLLTGGMLFLLDETTKDRINIIINSVSLCFVLELDNKVGAIMRAQMLWHASEAQPDVGRKILQDYVDAAPLAAAANGGSGGLFNKSNAEEQCNREREQQASSASPTIDDPSDNADLQQQRQQQQQQCCSCPQLLGLAYFALVGLLIFCEALLLAPQCNMQALAVLTICTKYKCFPNKYYQQFFKALEGQAIEASLMDMFMSDPTINPFVWFGTNNVWFYFASGGITHVKNFFANTVQQPSPVTGIGMCAAYICIVAILIFLLFRDLLPCSQAMHRVHRWWPDALMIAQIIVAVIAVTQYDMHPVAVYFMDHGPQVPWWYPATSPHNYVLATFFCCWGFVFVVWPLLFYYKWATTLLRKACNKMMSSCLWLAGKLACWLHVGLGDAAAAAGAAHGCKDANGQTATVGDGATSLV